MLKKIKFKQKLLIIGISMTIIPLILSFIIVFNQNKQKTNLAKQESIKMADKDLSNIVHGIYNLAKTQQEVIEKNLEYSLNVANDLAKKSGGINFVEETTRWRAVNQYTKDATDVDLPKIYKGDEWLGMIKDKNTKTPLVDEVLNLVGTTCTVFQKMNQQGDMLRVATNVIKKNGDRAIGTFIPATNPNGSTNPVIASVLQGRTYIGRAYVVDGWYITAYQPMYNSRNELTGMLYVGIPQENTTTLRNVIMDMVIGKTGYAFVIDSAGSYVISKKGMDDGKNIINVKGEDGRYYTKELISMAKKLGGGEVGDLTYDWRDKSDNQIKVKKIKFTYFKKWDWIICAGSFENEFIESAILIEQNAKKSDMVLISLIIISLVVTIIIWFLVAKSVMKQLGEDPHEIAKVARSIAKGDLKITFKNGSSTVGVYHDMQDMTSNLSLMLKEITSGVETLTSSSTELSAISDEMASSTEKTSHKSNNVAVSAQEMSGTMNSVAAATEQTSVNLSMIVSAAEEMSSTISEIAQNTAKGSETTTDAVKKAEDISLKVNQLGQAALEINKVTETISDISDQTNLLALNATIEAARAGEAGKGFTVVASEIKELAQQTAKATDEIGSKIADVQSTTKDSVEAIGAIAEVINEINLIVTSVATAIEEQSATTQEISTNVTQAAYGVDEVNKNITSASSAAGEVSKDIQMVNEASAEMKTGSKHVKTSASELSLLGEKLHNLVTKFEL